jgi:hypothetical protein
MPRGEDPHAALGASLRTSSALLCLDNAETVLGEVAPLVEALVERAPRLRILATTRERLAVHSEHVHRLAPLPLPSGPDPDNPAVRLFLERASGLEEPVAEAVLEDVALCAGVSTGSPSPSSSARPRPRPSASGSSPTTSPGSSTCWPGAGGRPRPGTGPCARWSTPPTAC